MTVIQVPKPPKSAWNPNRPLSTLLQSQIEHLYEAEKRLPHRYKSQIYTNAITTEGEAAEYIQKVTEAIQRAHADASAKRAQSPLKRAPKRKGTLAIAAVAEEPRPARGAKKAKAKKATAQSSKGKSSAAKAARKRK